MARFLNTDKLNEWIPRLIEEAEKELVIIVPYIKTSARIFGHLEAANTRGVETTIVYREDKLTQTEKDRLLSLDNLNLLHHPNIHAKCFLNEKFLIVSSMNLYEYSEKNNREMGALFHRVDLDKEQMGDSDPDHIFMEAVDEIRAIVNGAQIEKQSRETKMDGFEVEIIKTEKERALEACAILNKVFIHKRFTPVKNLKDSYDPVCKDYFDRIDVLYGYRMELTLHYDEARIEEIYKRFKPHIQEYLFPGFKFYWNHHTAGIYLYANSRHDLWQGDKTSTERVQTYKKGIDELITMLRRFI